MLSHQFTFTEDDFFHPRWYAVYVRVRHEKKIAEMLLPRIPSVFLPLYEVERVWQRRRVTLQLPLFASYLFAYLPLCDRLRLLEVPGVIQIVGRGNQPIAVPAEQIEALRLGMEQRTIEPHHLLTIGQRVRICVGPFEGMTGILVRKNKRQRVVISLDTIMQSFAVEVEAKDVEPVRTPPKAIGVAPGLHPVAARFSAIH